MQVTETNADGLKHEFKIVIPAGELETQITQRLDQLGRQIRLPGFRPGKVPQTLLRQRYGNAVRGEVLESTLQGSSAEAIRERNLRPALQPKVEIVSATEGSDLEYTMSVEVLPDLPQPDFVKLGLERLVVEIPDVDVDQAVARMAEQFRKSEPVTRAAKSGDILVADVIGKVGDQEIPGTKAEGRNIELGAEGLLPGFTEQLEKVKAGQNRSVKVTLPENYGNPDFAGKEAVFDITVKEVRERQPAIIDDKLAEEVGLENLGELKQEVRDRIARDYSVVTRQRLKRLLLDKLAAQYDFPVPPGMVEIEFNNIWQQHQAEKNYTAENAAASGEPAAEAGAPAEDDEKLKAEYRGLAERRVRLGLLLAEVGRNANINVTQDELNQALIREAQRFPGSERRVLDYYRQNPEAAGNLRAPIFEEKVVDYIVELAKPEERKVSPQELLALSEADEADEAAEKQPAEKKPRRQTKAPRTTSRPRKGAKE
ncbi:MAG TPA: trigger factor [Stellaceae bacterium]|nr:trigger factor [Stellaceae bacterium]